MQRIGIFGASGYLGSYLVNSALTKGFSVTAFVRSMPKASQLQKDPRVEYRQIDITNAKSLNSQLTDCDTIISTVGITRQKEGYSYDDIDYRANLNILREAQESGISRFIYIGVFKGQDFVQTALCRAKERFVSEIADSQIEFCIVRPTGFFSDMAEIFEMAKKGQVFLFGNGELQLNPIHGKDLADSIVNELLQSIRPLPKNFTIGGPIVYTQNEIAELAFNVLGQKENITRLPHWVRVTALRLGKIFLSSKLFGPFEFFLTSIATDMSAPQYGNITLKTFFESLARKSD